MNIEEKLSNILESIKYTESIGIARIKIENLLNEIRVMKRS